MSKRNRPSEGKAPRRKFQRLWQVAGVLILLAGIFVLLIPAWDSIAVESIRCEVVSAEPRTSSGGSRGSASTAGVLVQTSNCGSISVSQGVTFENEEKIASSFTKGSVFEFDLGWFSRVVMKDLGNGIPSVRDYRLAG